MHVAFGKFHAILLVTRLYDYIACKFVVEEPFDKLTMDTFEWSRRTSREKEGGELAKEAFQTCWNATILSCMADCCVLSHSSFRILRYRYHSSQEVNAAAILRFIFFCSTAVTVKWSDLHE
jgi:hypothetical protein